MPQRRIGKAITVALYAFTIVVDGIQILLDFFLVGGIVNIIIDVAMGVTLAIIFLLLGALDAKTTTALFGSLFADAIPYVSAFTASAWVLDVWYTIKRTNAVDDQKIAEYRAQQAESVQNIQTEREMKIREYEQRAYEEQSRRYLEDEVGEAETDLSRG